MIAEISRDGMLTIYGQTETERYATQRWFDSYLLGDSSPSTWGIRIGCDEFTDQGYLRVSEAK